MDRLAAFYYWNDYQGLEQAVLVAREHPFNLDVIEKWSRSEKMQDRFKKFLEELGKKN